MSGISKRLDVDLRFGERFSGKWVERICKSRNV